jgi:hypothetical protein
MRRSDLTLIGAVAKLPALLTLTKLWRLVFQQGAVA